MVNTPARPPGQQHTCFSRQHNFSWPDRCAQAKSKIHSGANDVDCVCVFDFRPAGQLVGSSRLIERFPAP